MPNVAIIPPNNPLHMELAELARKCHDAAEKGDTKTLQLLEEDIDLNVSNLWGITKEELEIIKNALEEA